LLKKYFGENFEGFLFQNQRASWPHGWLFGCPHLILRTPPKGSHFEQYRLVKPTRRIFMQTHRLWFFFRLLVAAGVLAIIPNLAEAHCDSLQGPVVADARLALERGETAKTDDKAVAETFVSSLKKVLIY
jgi:hypothetical protein